MISVVKIVLGEMKAKYLFLNLILISSPSNNQTILRYFRINYRHIDRHIDTSEKLNKLSKIKISHPLLLVYLRAASYFIFHFCALQLCRCFL